MQLSKTSLLATALICGITANAATYLLTDVGSNFVDNNSNWLLLDNSDTPSLYALPVVYDTAYTGEMVALNGTYKYVATATEITDFPSSTDNVYLTSYAYVDASGNNTTKNTGSVFMRASTSWGDVVQRGLQSIAAGSGFISDTDFTLSMNSYTLGYANATIKKHNKVNQSFFAFEVVTNAKVENCTFNLGEKNKDGVDNSFDIFAVGGNLNLVANSGSSYTTNLHVKNTIVNGNLTVSDNMGLNIFLTQSMFEEGNTVLTVDGKLKKGSTEITLDFTDVDWSIVEAGTYNLITAGTLEGFTQDDITLDFIEKAEENSTALRDGYESNIVWNNNTLQLVVTGVVPEPSTVALIFGAVAVAFVAIRRRK